SKLVPHLNIVLLGMDGVKASISRLLLGEKPSLVPTAARSMSVKQGEVCGLFITLVEMPALYNTQLSEQEVMRLTLNCVSVCDPGVHAFLIAVPEGPLTDEVKLEIKLIQTIFSSRVNDHTIFIINQQSQSEQLHESLQSVINANGWRYTFYSRNINAEKLFTCFTDLLNDSNSYQYTMAMYSDAQWETQLQYKKEIKNLQQQLMMSNQNQAQ
ncbi:GTPase IMAP family member 8-like, partial [Clarias magur]